MSAGDIATLATAVATLIAAITGLFKVLQTMRHVSSLHQEVRPPSNGTTAGAITEGTGAMTSWVGAELLNLFHLLGKEPSTPPPSPPLAVPSQVPPRPTALPFDSVPSQAPPATPPPPSS